MDEAVQFGIFTVLMFAAGCVTGWGTTREYYLSKMRADRLPPQDGKEE
jgi:hypothetical protein